MEKDSEAYIQSGVHFHPHFLTQRKSLQWGLIFIIS